MVLLRRLVFLIRFAVSDRIEQREIEGQQRGFSDDEKARLIQRSDRPHVRDRITSQPSQAPALIHLQPLVSDEKEASVAGEGDGGEFVAFVSNRFLQDGSSAAQGIAPDRAVFVDEIELPVSSVESEGDGIGGMDERRRMVNFGRGESQTHDPRSGDEGQDGAGIQGSELLDRSAEAESGEAPLFFPGRYGKKGDGSVVAPYEETPPSLQGEQADHQRIERLFDGR